MSSRLWHARWSDIQRK